MANDDELKKSVKELVKEIVSDTVSKMVKASAIKTVTGLRDRLKEEAARRAEDKLKKTAKELRKELGSDAKDAEYVSKFNKAFEEKFHKLLTSLSKGPLQPLIIASACALVVGGVAGGLVAANITGPTEPPPPQPDLVITEITFDVEVIPPEVEALPVPFEPAEATYQITVRYFIENQGDKAAGPSTTSLDLPHESLTDPVDSIAAGKSDKGTFYCDSFSVECFLDYLDDFDQIEIELCADAENVIEESNEENNSITLKLNPPFY